MVSMNLLPDEAKSLKPPGIINRYAINLGLMGWATAMLQNCLMNRPPLRSGVHRQVLLLSIGWFAGYHLVRYENYAYAKQDRTVLEYMKRHPEDFQGPEKKTMAEIVEPFHPIR